MKPKFKVGDKVRFKETVQLTTYQLNGIKGTIIGSSILGKLRGYTIKTERGDIIVAYARELDKVNDKPDQSELKVGDFVKDKFFIDYFSSANKRNLTRNIS